MASVFTSAVAQQVQDQPFWLRYKGSILIIVSGIAAVLVQVAASPDLQETSVPVILTTVATIVTTLVNRFTQDGITPSAAAKLEQAGHKAHLDRPSVSGVAVTGEPQVVDVEMVSDPERGHPGYAFGEPITADLPTYTGETSTQDTARHRAGE